MNRILFAALSCACLFVFASCGKVKKDEKPVATVNGAPIYASELKRELDLSYKRDPSYALAPEMPETRLNALIDKKLLIAEAVRSGMSDDKNFTDAIKVFWEQTLLRTLIDAKIKEWAGKITVTESDIAAYYAKLPFRAVFQYAKGATKEEAMVSLERVISPAPAQGNVGPLLVEDISVFNPFYQAFDLAEGETGFYRDGSGYIAIKAVKKEKLPAPQFSSVREKIQTALMEQKKENALEEWITALRKSAKINIDAEKVRETAKQK